MFPPFKYPAIKRPGPDDVYQAVEIIKKMADIAQVAGATPYCEAGMSSVLETIESNLRFASDTLYAALLPFTAKESELAQAKE